MLYQVKSGCDYFYRIGGRTYGPGDYVDSQQQLDDEALEQLPDPPEINSLADVVAGCDWWLDRFAEPEPILDSQYTLESEPTDTKQLFLEAYLHELRLRAMALPDAPAITPEIERGALDITLVKRLQEWSKPPQDAFEKDSNLIQLNDDKKRSAGERHSDQNDSKKVSNLPVDMRALAVFIAHPGWTKKRIAEKIGCHEKSLAPKRCPKLAAAIRAQRTPELPRGAKDSDGNIEAWDSE